MLYLASEKISLDVGCESPCNGILLGDVGEKSLGIVPSLVL